MKEVDDFIGKLVSGSIGVVANDRAAFERLETLNPRVRLFHVDDELANPGERIMEELFGKVPRSRPKFHFQLDVILCGDGTSERLHRALLEYAHPGALVMHQGRVRTFLPDSPKNVPFAKLRDGDKEYLASEIVRVPKDGLYVEIGSYKGGSAVLATLANPSARIYCVDIWQKAFDVFERHTQYFPNITPVIVEAHDLEAGPRRIAELEKVPLDELHIDLLFIDADHSFEAVLKDLEIYEKYARKVCGHDFHPLEGVERGIYTYFSEGAKRRLNEIYNRFYAKTYWRPFLPFLRPAFLDPVLFRPPMIGFKNYRRDDSSIWYKR